MYARLQYMHCQAPGIQVKWLDDLFLYGIWELDKSTVSLNKNKLHWSQIPVTWMSRTDFLV